MTEGWGHAGAIRSCARLARAGMAVLVSKSVYYHCTGRVDISTAVFSGAVCWLCVCRFLSDGSAYGVFGAVCLGFSVQSIWPSLLYGAWVGCEDRVSGQRHASLVRVQLQGFASGLAILQNVVESFLFLFFLFHIAGEIYTSKNGSNTFPILGFGSLPLYAIVMSQKIPNCKLKISGSFLSNVILECMVCLGIDMVIFFKLFPSHRMNG